MAQGIGARTDIPCLEPNVCCRRLDIPRGFLVEPSAPISYFRGLESETMPISSSISANTGAYASEDEALAEIVGRIVRDIHPVSVYLFGSRARGDHRPDSDFDLLVVTDERDGEAGDDYDRVYRPILGTGVGCDVVPCRRDHFLRESVNPTGLIREILDNGIRIYDREAR